MKLLELNNFLFKLISDYRLMVRTLDFHSNNVGSNPTNPKINNKKNKIIEKFIFLKNYYEFSNIYYEFSFTSLIPPFIGYFKKSRHLNLLTQTKIHFKKSYLLAS